MSTISASARKVNSSGQQKKATSMAGQTYRYLVMGASAASLCFGCTTKFAKASITINSSFLYAYADNTYPVAFGSSFSGTAVPTSTTLNAYDFPNYSENNINWSENGAQTVLSFDIAHGRSGDQGSYSQTYQSPLNFTADANTTYNLSGFYDVTDVGSTESGFVSFEVSLRDTADPSGYLFRNRQLSDSTHDEQFLVGNSGGDDSNDLLEGSVTGNLVAGKTYELFFGTYIWASPNADSGATALGNVTLTIGDSPGIVPEPTSVLIWIGLGLACIGTYKLRSSRSA